MYLDRLRMLLIKLSPSNPIRRLSTLFVCLDCGWTQIGCHCAYYMEEMRRQAEYDLLKSLVERGVTFEWTDEEPYPGQVTYKPQPGQVIHHIGDK